MDTEILAKLSLVVGLLVSMALRAFPLVSSWFAGMSRNLKIGTLIFLAVLYAGAALIGDPSADALFDALLSLGGMLGGAAAGYTMWGGKSQG